MRHFLSLIFILFLGIISKTNQASPKKISSSLSDLPLLNAYASKNGTVKLHYDTYYGYFAYVDFQNLESDTDSSDSYETTTTSTGAMKIGLYTSQTWLNFNCMEFSYYDCGDNSCSQYTWNTAAEDLPYLTADGYYASATAYLDYNSWSLSSEAAIINSCISNANYDYGYNRTGIIGMGIQDSSFSNFQNTPLFSIYIDPNTSNGELTFQVDQDKKADPDSTGISLSADNNWHVSLEDAYFVVQGQNTLYINVYYNNIIFDLDSPAIGLPYDNCVYESFVTSFAQIAGVSCTSDLIYPTCYYYYGNVSGLPNVTLNAQSQDINIPPQVYIQGGISYDNDTSISTFSLNVRALSYSQYGDNFVTYNYQNYIILGSSFLTYYYAVFDSSGPTITLNVANNQFSDDSFPWLYLYSGGGVAGFILFVVCCACCCKSKKAKKSKGRVVPNVSSEQSVQAPLVANGECTSIYSNQDAPVYGAYAYANYPQQSYGAMPGYGYGQPYVQQPQGYNPYDPNWGREQTNK